MQNYKTLNIKQKYRLKLLIAKIEVRIILIISFNFSPYIFNYKFLYFKKIK